MYRTKLSFEKTQNELMHIEGPEGIEERAKQYAPFFLKFGENVVVEAGCFFSHPQNIVIDDGTSINRQVYIYGSGGVRIGRKVRIGPGTFIHSANHDLPRQGDTVVDWKGSYTYDASIISDFCLLSAHCIILPGVNLFPSSKIAAGVTLTRGFYNSKGWIVNGKSK